MVKKRHALATYGTEGATKYAAESPRSLSIRSMPFVSGTEFSRTVAARFEVLEDAGDRYTLRPPATRGSNDGIPLDGRARTM